MDWKDPVKYVPACIWPISACGVTVVHRLDCQPPDSPVTERLVGFCPCRLPWPIFSQPCLGRLLKSRSFVGTPSCSRCCLFSVRSVLAVCSVSRRTRPFSVYIALLWRSRRTAGGLVICAYRFSVVAIYSAAFSFIPFILAIVFTNSSKRLLRKPNRPGGCKCGCLAAATVYFVFFANRFLFMDRAEMNVYCRPD